MPSLANSAKENTFRIVPTGELRLKANWKEPKEPGKFSDLGQVQKYFANEVAWCVTF